MIYLGIGILVWLAVAVFILALCRAAGDADRAIERMVERERQGDDHEGVVGIPVHGEQPRSLCVGREDHGVRNGMVGTVNPMYEAIAQVLRNTYAPQAAVTEIANILEGEPGFDRRTFWQMAVTPDVRGVVGAGRPMESPPTPDLDHSRSLTRSTVRRLFPDAPA